jgi:hypothetical protein
MRAYPVSYVSCTTRVRRTRNGPRRRHIRLQITGLWRMRYLVRWLRVSRRWSCRSLLCLSGRMRYLPVLRGLIVLRWNRMLILGRGPRNLTLGWRCIPWIRSRCASLRRISRIGRRTRYFTMRRSTMRRSRILARRSLVPGLGIRPRRRGVVSWHRWLALLKVPHRPRLTEVARRRVSCGRAGRVILVAVLRKRRHGQRHRQHQAGGRPHPALEVRSHRCSPESLILPSASSTATDQPTDSDSDSDPRPDRVPANRPGCRSLRTDPRPSRVPADRPPPFPEVPR